MKTNVLTPSQDFALMLESLIQVEGHTPEAALAGAQKYALETCHDLRDRADNYSECGFHIQAEKLLSLSCEYHKLAMRGA